MRTSTVIASDSKGLKFNLSRSFNHDDGHRRCRDSGRRFDVQTLPVDLHRVYKHLYDQTQDEQYALTIVFMIRTAVELHRAWHMTLLTSKLLQQLKHTFQLRMTWNLGVTDLIFRMEDGLYELHRRIPYDYDSEFQDLYEKIAIAVIEGEIGIHDALIIQLETKRGKHTARNGLLLRTNPGRLVLYPFQAATTCVIFFGGDWYDCGVAAICGLVAGIIQWILSSKSVFANVNESAILTDMFVGFSTGIIGGLFVQFYDHTFCLSGIFLGTLYWFFYGTAFVIGLLEIVGGELNTGVVRFLAVSIKTFVLSVASAVGLTVVLQGDVYRTWSEQLGQNTEYCVNGLAADPWWRIPFYLLCSVSVLGQYRFIFRLYWVGLIVQLVAYEVQFQVGVFYEDAHSGDGMDTVIANICAAVAAVATASILCIFLEFARNSTVMTILHKNEKEKLSVCGKCINSLYAQHYNIMTRLGIAKGLFFKVAKIREKLEDLPGSQVLSEKEEATLIAGIVERQEINVWSFLMPAVYQLVPGSKIALFFYAVIFPPKAVGVDGNGSFYDLMLISVSLALGLVLGLALVRVVGSAVFKVVVVCRKTKLNEKSLQFRLARYSNNYSRKSIQMVSKDHDPSDRNWKTDFESMWEHKDQGSSIREDTSGDLQTNEFDNPEKVNSHEVDC